ncbi:uncharacterized protein ACNLHF_024796 [Anomaloglossus baeobatrachus]|uniref:uncharacterized protein LOC142246634 n=1 Tax=Anomaloglossus baeobatrachus TaxID=238106 RepID=UPI003F4FAEF8
MNANMYCDILKHCIIPSFCITTQQRPQTYLQDDQCLTKETEAPVEGAPIGNRNQRSIPENKIQGGDNIVLPNNSQDLMVIIAIVAIVFVLVITAAAISTLIYKLWKNNKSRRDEEGLWHADKDSEYYDADFYSLWHSYKKRECRGRPKGEHEKKIKLIADHSPNGPKTENGDVLEETKISVSGPPEVIIGMPDEDVVTASGPPDVIIGMPDEDVITVSGPPDVIIGMPDEDVVTASGPPDEIIGMPDEDVVTASGPPDVISMPDEDVVTASDKHEEDIVNIPSPPPLPSYKTLFGQGTDMIGSEGSMSDDKKDRDLQPRHTQEMPEHHQEYLDGDWASPPVMDGCDVVTSADGEHEDNMLTIVDDAPHGPETENREIVEEIKISVSGPLDVVISMPDEDVVTSSDEEEEIEDSLPFLTRIHTCQCVNMPARVQLFFYFKSENGDLLPW